MDDAVGLLVYRIAGTTYSGMMSLLSFSVFPRGYGMPSHVKFGTHLFCTGAASTAALKGYPSARIQEIVHRMSAAYRTYIYPVKVRTLVHMVMLLIDC